MSNNISIDLKENLPTKQHLTERVLCDYNREDQNEMESDKIIYREELKKNKTKFYKNQKIIADKVVSAFKDRKKINIMVVSKTQSGKTGSMCLTIKQYIEDNLIKIENIYIITGLSSCEWQKQTRDRMPKSMGDRVFHRGDLLKPSFVNEIKNNKNVLIIMDEIQVAARTNQTIWKTFKNAGLLDTFKLYKNDIKILEYTATPDGTIYDLMKWKDASDTIIAEPGDGYISSYDLLLLGRVKQYKDLCGYDTETHKINKEVFDSIRDIKKDIDNYSNPLYHIIRTKNGDQQNKTIENFKSIFKDTYNFIHHDGKTKTKNKTKKNDINEILEKKPERHTFIFIKEMIRCAKSLKKKYIGILYDRYTKKPDDSTMYQGLAGRGTGYDDNGISICYTNIDSIERYEKLWHSKFEDKTIKWNSKTTKYKNGIISGKNTFNDPNEYDGLSSDDSDEPIIKRCTTQAEVKAYYNAVLKEKLKGRGPNKRKQNPKTDYYEVSWRKQKKVYTYDNVNREIKGGLTKGTFRLWPCYDANMEKSTLQWWLVHY